MSIRFILILAACLSFSPRVWAQKEAVHHNIGTETNKFIWADKFINDGYFEVQNFQSLTNLSAGQIFDVTLTPYDMSETRSYVNNGTFRALSARFEFVNEFAERTPADDFTVGPGGIMDFADGFHFGTFVEPLFSRLTDWFAPVSLISVDAKTVKNQGLMRIGAGGAMELGKTNQVDGSFNALTVDLTDGIVAVDTIGNAYGVPITTSFQNQLLITTVGSNFVNELGIYDFFWGQGVQTNQDVSTFMIGSTITTPEFTVLDQYGARLRTSMQLPNPKPFGFSFTQKGTNIYIETVFVQTADTNVTVDAVWYPIEYYNNASIIDPRTFYSPIVKLSSITTNALTLQTEESSIYIMDQLGGSTNNAIIGNDRYQFFARPNNYFVTRSTPIEFLVGFPPTFTPDSTTFYDIGFSNQIVTNFYAAYDFRMENFVYNPPLVPGVSVHDLPGRIEINAQTVDLTRTGIRAEGLFSVTTDQLASSTNTVIDSQFLSFDLGFTSPPAAKAPLKIQNLAKDRIARFQGEFTMWSGVWTNQIGIPSGSGTNAVTNVFNLLYHSLVIDATTVNSIQPVGVADFRARTESLQIFDNMIVSNRFEATSKDVTISGNIELRNLTFGPSNFPNATNLVLETTGSLTSPGLAEFGSVSKPLTNFVNRGQINSYSQSIVADNVDISGQILSGQNVFFLTSGFFGGFFYTNFFLPDSGPLYITANRSARLNGATLSTFGTINLNGPVYKIDKSSITAGTALNLNVTSVLQDTGANSGNSLSASNSITLSSPAIGSLLGTTVDLLPAVRDVARLTWAVATNSTTASLTNIPTAASWPTETNRAFLAYSTNLAIGVLKLHSGTNTVFEFRGTGRGKALFVDLLEIDGPGITNLVSLTNQIRIISDASTSIDVYFADAVSSNLEKNLNLGLQNATEFRNLAEILNGKKLGGGTFHWVPSFNGPNSSIDVVVNNQSVKMNRSLRQSRIIDMDADGIANAYDDMPLENKPGPVKITDFVISQVDGKVNVKFNAFLGTYKLEYSDSMVAPTWKQVSSFTQRSSTASLQTLVDPVATATQRYYRLVFYP